MRGGNVTRETYPYSMQTEWSEAALTHVMSLPQEEKQRREAKLISTTRLKFLPLTRFTRQDQLKIINSPLKCKI